MNSNRRILVDIGFLYFLMGIGRYGASPLPFDSTSIAFTYTGIAKDIGVGLLLLIIFTHGLRHSSVNKSPIIYLLFIFIMFVGDWISVGLRVFDVIVRLIALGVFIIYTKYASKHDSPKNFYEMKVRDFISFACFIIFTANGHMAEQSIFDQSVRYSVMNNAWDSVLVVIFTAISLFFSRLVLEKTNITLLGLLTVAGVWSICCLPFTGINYHLLLEAFGIVFVLWFILFMIKPEKNSCM